MSKYKGPHAKLNFKKAALYGEQQGFGPFRQRFAPQPKVKKTAPSAANAGEGRKTQKPNQYKVHPYCTCCTCVYLQRTDKMRGERHVQR